MRKRLLLLFLLIVSPIFLHAQVGINTIDPDESSSLDIRSTESGLLIPRMTTAQRQAIVEPAHSLLVYDTDLDGYYYNQGTPSSEDWVLLLTDTNTRDNYVIVKSVEDFPGGGQGGTITLDTNTLYEINGVITTSQSINVNGAYVVGKDTNEDVINYTGSASLFVGSQNASFRNLTFNNSNTGSVFDLSASNTNSLIAQSVVVNGFSSVGSVAGYGLVFFNVLQYIGNSDGITYSDIGNLLLNNMGWQPSNGGAYETFTGTFGFIQKISGFSTVASGAVGIDVSSNPTVENATVKQTVFTGSGDYVMPYSSGQIYAGYNFTNDWAVDCVGIPKEIDDSATGIIFIERNTGSSGPVFDIGSGRKPIEGTYQSNDLFRMSDSANGLTENVLQYNGKAPRQFQVSSSISYETTSGTSSTVLAFYVVRYDSAGNLLEIPNGIESYDEVDVNNSVRNVSVVGTVTMNPGDYVRVFAQLISSGSSPRDTLRAYSMNLSLF